MKPFVAGNIVLSALLHQVLCDLFAEIDHSQTLMKTKATTNLSLVEPGMSFGHLFNEILDQGLNWAKFKYLCNYDPTLVPAVNQDDLNVSYALTISDIKVKGLSNIQRIQDIRVHRPNVTEQLGGANINNGRYILSSALGINDVQLGFHVQVLKIASLHIFDFIANGSFSDIQVPFTMQLSPSKFNVVFEELDIKNLEKLNLTLHSQNFITTVGWSLPYVEEYIKNHIKVTLKDHIEVKIQEGKTYLNNMLNTSLAGMAAVTTVSMNDGSIGESNIKCPARPQSPPSASAEPNATRDTTPILHYFKITPGTQLIALGPKMFSLLIKYKSVVVSTIPHPGIGPNPESNGLSGYFNSGNSEFTLTAHGGETYRHKASKTAGEISWPLDASRDGNIFMLFATDDSNGHRLRLNPFITKKHRSSASSSNRSAITGIHRTIK